MFIVILGIIQFSLLLMIFSFEYKNRSPAMYLWGTLFLMFGVMHLFSSIFGDNQYTDITLMRASLFVIGFCLLYFGLRFFLIISTKKKLQGAISIDVLEKRIDKNYKKIFNIFIFIGVLKLIPLVRYAGSILNTSWSVMRSYSLEQTYVGVNGVIYYLFFSLGGVVALCWLKKDYFRVVIYFIFMIINVLLVRNRVEILPAICSFLFILSLKYKSITYKSVFFGSISVIFIIYFIYALRAFRWYGTLEQAINQFSFKDLNDLVLTFIKTGDGELGLRRVFYYFISHDNRFIDFGKGHTYLRMIFVYLPTRWSFGLKPGDFAQTMAHALGSSAGGSMHPTLFGDCYANLGYIGISLGCIWAIVVSAAEKLIIKFTNSFKILSFILCCYSFIIIGRGAVYNGFVIMAWGFLILALVDFSINKLKR